MPDPIPAAPIEQAVVDYLAAVLGRIATANGYRTAAGSAVWTDEPEFAPEGATTDRVRLLLVDEDIAPRGAHAYTLTLRILARTYADREHTAYPRRQARAVLADIRQAMDTIDLMDADAPVGVEAVRFGGSRIPERELGDNWLWPEATYTIDFSQRAP
jgi:hypothetical protein